MESAEKKATTTTTTNKQAASKCFSTVSYTDNLLSVFLINELNPYLINRNFMCSLYCQYKWLSTIKYFSLMAYIGVELHHYMYVARNEH